MPSSISTVRRKVDPELPRDFDWPAPDSSDRLLQLTRIIPLETEASTFVIPTSVPPSPACFSISATYTTILGAKVESLTPPPPVPHRGTMTGEEHSAADGACRFRAMTFGLQRGKSHGSVLNLDVPPFTAG
ncbi:hypothetical protein SCUP515_02463 [Seiridium cupressi]|uniref:Uncharacterized protein n=1 Tax=Seiridium unicorne TaxID=138068 RepID=A0ABR2UET6_9PEZI